MKLSMELIVFCVVFVGLFVFYCMWNCFAHAYVAFLKEIVLGITDGVALGSMFIKYYIFLSKQQILLHQSIFHTYSN